MDNTACRHQTLALDVLGSALSVASTMPSAIHGLQAISAQSTSLDGAVAIAESLG